MNIKPNLDRITIGYCRVSSNKQKDDLDFAENYEMLKSTKRSALRSEYLQIYNSSVFTNKQKYEMTRELIETYTNLDGNHYIHKLDRILKTYAEVHPNSVWKGNYEDEIDK